VADNCDTKELTGEQATRAVELMRWCARSGLQITNAAGLRKLAQRAEELQAILAQLGGRATLRDLDRSHSFTKEELRALAGQFPARFTVEQLNTGGRPSEVLRLHV